MDGAEPIFVCEIRILVDLPINIGVKAGVGINVPAMGTAGVKVVKDLTRTGNGRPVAPAPSGISAGVGHGSPCGGRSNCCLSPQKGVIHETVRETLPSARSGYDWDDKNGVEVLAVHRIEAALFKRAESREAGLRERSGSESK